MAEGEAAAIEAAKAEVKAEGAEEAAEAAEEKAAEACKEAGEAKEAAEGAEAAANNATAAASVAASAVAEGTALDHRVLECVERLEAKVDALTAGHERHGQLLHDLLAETEEQEEVEEKPAPEPPKVEDKTPAERGNKRRYATGYFG